MEKVFQVSDRVRWRSSNKNKEGEVVAIVPPHGDPRDAYFALGGHEKLNFQYGGGMRRNKESYLVAVLQTGTRKTKLYWPLTSLMEKIDVVTTTPV